MSGSNNQSNRKGAFNSLQGIEKLYVEFLFHCYLIHNEKIIVFGEGKTDGGHLRLAYNQLFPEGGEGYSFKSLLGLGRLSEILGIKSDGVPNLYKLKQVFREINKSKKLPKNPCIILVDGDAEGRKFFDSDKSSKSNINGNIRHAFENLYIRPTAK